MLRRESPTWSDSLMAGHGFPDEDIVWRGVCKHYLWREDLARELPEALKLIAQRVGSSLLQAVEPHPVYLLMRQHQLTITDVLELSLPRLRKRQRRIPKTRNLKQVLAQMGDFELKPLTAPKELEQAWDLDIAGEDSTRRHRLLRRWWWSINHADDRWDESAETWLLSPNRDLQALSRCLQILLKQPELSALERAEALRQLGRIDEARSAYLQVELSLVDTEDQKLYHLVGDLISAGSIEPQLCRKS